MHIKIKVLFLDVGGVLVRFMDDAPHEKWEKYLGLRHGQLRREIHKREPAGLATIGVVDGETIWQDIQRKYNLSDEQLHQLRKDYYTADVLNEAFYEYIKKLHKQYTIVILSNAWKDGRKIFMERYHLDEITDQMIISAEEGMIKPHKKIYKLALRRLGVKPEEALFVDDTPKNIKAAAEVGMHTVLFTHTQETIEKIEKLLNSK